SGAIWIGTASGLAKFHNGAFTKKPADPVVALGEDASGDIYFATAGGVFTAAEKSILQNGAPLRTVDAFYRDPEGGLWMGTLGGGLRLLENGKMFAFFMRDGLFDSEIYGITGDNEGHLWMACSKGIFAVSRAELRKFAAGHVRKITSNPYSPT